MFNKNFTNMKKEHWIALGLMTTAVIVGTIIVHKGLPFVQEKLGLGKKVAVVVVNKEAPASE